MSKLTELSHSPRCLRNYYREWMLVKNFVPVDSYCRKSVMRLQRFFSPSTLNFTKLDSSLKAPVYYLFDVKIQEKGTLLKFPSKIVGFHQESHWKLWTYLCQKTVSSFLLCSECFLTDVVIEVPPKHVQVCQQNHDNRQYLDTTIKT